MRSINDAADEFLAQRRIAVTGVSRSPASHVGNVVYRRLRERGYAVSAVNPHAEEVEGDPAYHDLASIPGGVDAVVIATRPDHAGTTVRDCIDLGIDRVWLHGGPGPSSVSREAVDLARAEGIEVIDGGCPLMFGPTRDTAHRCLRPVLALMGWVPRRV